MKLSDFKDEKAIEVVADLLEPIFNIISNAENAKAANEGTLKFAAAILKNSKHDVMTMLAVLDDKDPEMYHCTAVTVLQDVMIMLSDDDLLQLFGLQGRTPTSAALQSTNIGVENQ